MKLKNFFNKDTKALNQDLTNLLREKFSMKMQKTSERIKTHILKNIARDIARIKTVLSMKAQKKGQLNHDNK